MNTRDIAFTALFAAFMAILANLPQLVLPLLPVPITAQTLGVILAGAILGGRLGALAMTLYLLLAAIGLPVLAGGRGGLGVLFGPTGGFLFSYPVAAYVTGWLVERYWNRMNSIGMFGACLVGGIMVYPLGLLWLSVAVDQPISSVALASLPFVPGDLVKVVAATAIALIVRRSYPLIDPSRRSTS